MSLKILPLKRTNISVCQCAVFALCCTNFVSVWLRAGGGMETRRLSLVLRCSIVARAEPERGFRSSDTIVCVCTYADAVEQILKSRCDPCVKPALMYQLPVTYLTSNLCPPPPPTPWWPTRTETTTCIFLTQWFCLCCGLIWWSVFLSLCVSQSWGCLEESNFTGFLQRKHQSEQSVCFFNLNLLRWGSWCSEPTHAWNFHL